MIIPITKVNTPLHTLHEAIESFFTQLESCANFNEIQFPNWFNTVYSNTDLKKHLETFFTAYKAIPDKNKRDEIINAFNETNKIKKICLENGVATKPEKLHPSIQAPLKKLFSFIWDNSLRYDRFNTHIKETVDDFIDKFSTINKIEVCPFCGLENIVNPEGEASTALDHWLCQKTYPYIIVNFDNLVPIGNKCNCRPAKGTKNVVDIASSQLKAFYPYCNHKGVSVKFSFINEPTLSSNKIKRNDWKLEITPNDNNDKLLFDSWMYLFNIQARYEGIIEKAVFKNWDTQYRSQIENSLKLSPANNIDEFKTNLKEFKNSFSVNFRERSIVYMAFLDYLINRASDRYLTGLYQNFLRT